MQKQSLNTARKARFLGSADKCQQSNAVLGNNLHGFVWHCHGNPPVPQPPLPSSWNEPDCGTDPDVKIIFLIDEERWCLLLLKCSHNHRRHSATNTLLLLWKSCSSGLDGCCSPRASSLQGQASTSSGTRKVMDWELDTGTIPLDCCIVLHSTSLGTQQLVYWYSGCPNPFKTVLMWSL